MKEWEQSRIIQWNLDENQNREVCIPSSRNLYSHFDYLCNSPRHPKVELTYTHTNESVHPFTHLVLFATLSFGSIVGLIKDRILHFQSVLLIQTARNVCIPPKSWTKNDETIVNSHVTTVSEYSCTVIIRVLSYRKYTLSFHLDLRTGICLLGEETLLITKVQRTKKVRSLGKIHTHNHWSS